ncbi:MAG: hypothetical protein M3P51_12430, partial [Chloroflexota bacterium]|nr:hypothetical protein [Chloroflexota bacterium]
GLPSTSYQNDLRSRTTLRLRVHQRPIFTGGGEPQAQDGCWRIRGRLILGTWDAAEGELVVK